MLCGKSESSGFMYNGIKNDFSIDVVIQEDKLSSKTLLMRRIGRIGLLKVINQVFFQVFITKILVFISKRRRKYLIKNYNLNADIPEELIISVKTVNSKKCIDLITSIKPDVIIVNGTRIINAKVLKVSDALFINTHVGITPEYRGVHGAYWALRNNDFKNCGVTIHKVDKGIDTGGIIMQNRISIDPKDNFTTYPLHQINEAIYMMNIVLKDLSKGDLKTYKKENVPSKLWYHPTFTGYLYNRVLKSVK